MEKKMKTSTINHFKRIIIEGTLFPAIIKETITKLMRIYLK